MKKTLFRGLLGAALTILVCLPAASRGKGPKKTCEFTDADFRTEKILEALPIRATFLDEVSWDIPHQNWGVKEWDAILSDIAGAVDILAFQDGQVDYDELYDYLVVNRELAERYGMECWTNVESFDRDMPIRFLPIKWEKFLFKLDAARRAGMQNVITFEFSHFMSPNSSYTQAGHLYNRYMEYMNYLQHKK